MVCFLLDLAHSFEIAGGRTYRVNGPVRNPAATVPSLTHRLLDEKPSLNFLIVAPHRTHLRPGVSLDQCCDSFRHEPEGAARIGFQIIRPSLSIRESERTLPSVVRRFCGSLPSTETVNLSAWARLEDLGRRGGSRSKDSADGFPVRTIDMVR